MASVTPTAYNGRYELTRQIARGGMAEVYLARDLLLDRPVALKVLFPELSVDHAFVERFRREAQAAANLSHPNIVSVFDWGEAERTYFIVMEYIDGQPLSKMIRSEGKLAAAQAASIGAEVASALQYAHNHGVIHRDVKPGNVLIAADGQVKVADFGIARANSAEDSLTQTGAVMGTATYFSPEQAKGEGVDSRSDVYSLGVVLYEMLTGQAPFKGENPVSIAYKHVQEAPVPPRQLNPEVPEQLEAIVLHALAKDVSVRYQTASALRADLLRFSQGRFVHAEPPTTALAAAAASAAAYSNTGTMDPVTQSVSAMATSVTPAVGAQPARPVVEQAKKRNYLWLLLLLLLLGLLLAALLVAKRMTNSVTVPRLSGQSLGTAEQTLSADGLRYTVNGPQSAGARVSAQTPSGGSTVSRNTQVNLATTIPLVTVPNVVNETYQKARSTLRASGFKVSETPSQTGVQPGYVLQESPTGRAAAGSVISLTVSQGNNLVQVPDVTNRSASTAANILLQAGFSIGNTIQSYSNSIAQGRVIYTSPSAGTATNQNTAIDIYVSQGAEPATTAPTTSTTTATTTPTTTATTTPTTTATTTPTTTATTTPTTTATTTPTTIPSVKKG